MYYKTKTPGSLMIMGEHSVLHFYPSIVAAVDKYIYVAVRKGKFGKIRIDSDYFGEYETNIQNIKISKDFDLILAIVKRYKQFLTEGIEVQIKSDFSPELGLGSSGALLVGVTSALMMMLEKKIDKQELLQETLSILKNVRKFSSGSDLAASIYGGVVYFDPQNCTAEVLADSLPIVAMYSGYKTKTDKVIEKINKNFQGRESVLKRIYSKSGGLTKMAASAIRNKDYVALGKLMNSANKVVYESLSLITNELQNIIDELRKKDFIYGAKVSGAGLGDCAIAISSGHAKFTELQVIPLSIIPLPKFNNHYNSSLRGALLCGNPSTKACALPRFSRSDGIESTTFLNSKCLNKIDVVNEILQDKINNKPTKKFATAFAPSNIALCKYWGKRDEELHLPVNSSLSVSLDNFGSRTKIFLCEEDKVKLNGKLLKTDSEFVSKIFRFIDLFRQKKELKFCVDINSDIPVAAGLASSAAGFAALVLALNDLFGWQLSVKELSILARLGSGSAARSIEKGFVQWNKGCRSNGMDSYAEKLLLDWPTLCIGILIIDQEEKHIASRSAMKITKETSPLFKSWPNKAEQDITHIIDAIKKKDFAQFGEILEENSNRMHEMMATSKPSLVYSNPKTKKVISKIKYCRETMLLPMFYTQDAGPNLVIFFEKKNMSEIILFFQNSFPNYTIVSESRQFIFFCRKKLELSCR
jgi:diphosphomevalonate decarboxylase